MTMSASTTTLTMVSDEEIAISRAFDAPRQLVFEAHTKPEHVTQWLLGPEGWTMPVCEIDLRPGGSWRFAWQHPDGSKLEMTGVYREIVPPERIVNTERWGPEWPETVNTTLFTEDDGRTTVSQVIRYASKQARDAALATGMMSGVERSYELLDALLAAQQ
jgi:uncharacterized protein YndB with AHSA1/START domain